MNNPQTQFVADYRKTIVEMTNNIENSDSLKRLYDLTSYLYIHKSESNEVSQ